MALAEHEVLAPYMKRRKFRVDLVVPINEARSGTRTVWLPTSVHWALIGLTHNFEVSMGPVFLLSTNVHNKR